MMNKVSFMGKEALLTKPVKKMAEPLQEYIADGAILKDSANKAVKTAEKVIQEDFTKMNEAYKAAHGVYTIPKVETENELFGKAYMDAHGIQ